MCDFGKNEAEGTVMLRWGVITCSSHFHAQEDVRVQTRDAVISQSKSFKDKDVLITESLHGFTSPGLPWAP